MTPEEIKALKRQITTMLDRVRKIVEELDEQIEAFDAGGHLCEFAPHALNVAGLLGELYAWKDPIFAACDTLHAVEKVGVDEAFDTLLVVAREEINDAITSGGQVRLDFLEDCHEIAHAEERSRVPGASKEILNLTTLRAVINEEA